MSIQKNLKFEYFQNQSKQSVSRLAKWPNGKEITSILALESENCYFLDPHSQYDYAYLRTQKKVHYAKRGEHIRVADLFCGCGGLSLGAMETCIASGKDFQVVAAVDNSQHCLNVYKNNFPRATIYHQDICILLDGFLGSGPTKTEAKFLSQVGNVDLLLAGPPCQGNSDLNNHTRRNDSRNSLYEKVARFAELTKPESVIIENVPAAIHGKDKSVQRSIKSLIKMGYYVDSGTIDLAMLGVPQKRKRHVVVASKKAKPNLTRIVAAHRIETIRTVRWAIGDLEEECKTDYLFRPTAHSKENLNRIRYLFDYDLYDLPDHLRPPCHRDGNHSYKSMYGRIKENEPAQTITSGFSSPGQGRFIHPTKARTLTPHEAARLQFFPDSFDFSNAGSRSALCKMIGNAVPPKLSFILTSELLAH